MTSINQVPVTDPIAALLGGSAPLDEAASFDLALSAALLETTPGLTAALSGESGDILSPVLGAGESEVGGGQPLLIAGAATTGHLDDTQPDSSETGTDPTADLLALQAGAIALPAMEAVALSRSATPSAPAAPASAPATGPAAVSTAQPVPAPAPELSPSTASPQVLVEPAGKAALAAPARAAVASQPGAAQSMSSPQAAGTPEASTADRPSATVLPNSTGARVEEPAGFHRSSEAAAAPISSPVSSDPATSPTPQPVFSAPTSASVSAAPSAPAAIAAQVIPEVTRAFSNGEGQHRLTLQLNPRALGDVRVTVTVNHGTVRVRVSASPEAQQAIAATCSDLFKALEQAGASDARLSFTDPSIGSRDPGNAMDPGADQRHHDPQHSGMGAGHTATDGINPTTTEQPTRGSQRSVSHGSQDARAVDVWM